jgi:hypothetical protein
MKHGITEQEWNDYLDGCAPLPVRDRIEAHLTGCLSCWEFYEQMSGATEALQAAGEEARRELTLTDRQLHRMVRGVFAEIHQSEGQSEAQANTQLQGRLNSLETTLAPFCGTQVAARALQTAALHSPARSLEKVTQANWEPFLERLTAIAAALCGDTFATLLREQGQL